jgi:hypothetical protein
VFVEQLELEGPKETFDGTVVEAVTDGAHGAEQASGTEPATEGPRRVLTGFNPSSQHWLIGLTIDVRLVLQRASSIRVPCGGVS